MDTPLKKERIYVFDACAYIELGQIDEKVMTLPAAIWITLEEMMANGKIVSPRYVYDEVVINPQKPNKPLDNISKWLAPFKSHFTKENRAQVQYMIEVIKSHPKLIEPAYEKSQADPWLVAMARDLNITYPDKEHIIVTQENPVSSIKLPAAAKAYGVKTIQLKEFFEETGIKLSVS